MATRTKAPWRYILAPRTSYGNLKFYRILKILRLAWDSNRNIFTLQSHKNTYAFFRPVLTRHLLHAVLPPGGKTYQAGFAILSSTEVSLHDIEVCFITTSTRMIQIDVCLHFTCITKICIFVGADRALPSHSPATWWQNVPNWLCDIF